MWMTFSFSGREGKEGGRAEWKATHRALVVSSG